MLLPEEPGYDASASPPERHDRSPTRHDRLEALGAADVIHGVNFTREHGVTLAMRGGRLTTSRVKRSARVASCVDLSRMRSVHVDPATRRARIEGGALLSDVDKETQAFGLAVPVAISSTTAIAGLTLGGGFWLDQPQARPRDR